MTAAPAAGHFDGQALSRAFNRAAAGYDAAAWLQHQAQSELLQRLQFFALRPEWVLDLGAGTCSGTRQLARCFRHARIVALDLAPQMLAQAPRVPWWGRRYERVCANAYALPLASASCDLIFSNLMLQWCERLDELFTELRRVLRPEGLLLFSSFAPATLQELRAAWASADAGPHVTEFADLPQVAEALLRAGFIEPVIDVERQRRHYPSVQALKRELKQIGAQNADHARSRGLGGRARTEAMRAAYERLREADGLPVTWELLFGTTFAGRGPVKSAERAGEQVVSLAQVRRRDRSARPPSATN